MNVDFHVSLRAAAMLAFVSLLSSCVSVRRPMMSTAPRELGSRSGSIAVGARPAGDVTECISQKTVSTEGVAYAVAFFSRDDYRVTVASTPEPAKLTIHEGGNERTVVLDRVACARHDVSFFERDKTLHGSASLDCTTSEGRVQVNASFDSCAGEASPATTTIERTPFSNRSVTR